MMKIEIKSEIPIQKKKSQPKKVTTEISKE